MDIFISWSGPRSKQLAEFLRSWLPKVIQAVKPWISASDIEKGARWAHELADRLNSCNFGLVCVTPENMSAPWLLFEVGALSKALGSARVCPVLLDLTPVDLKGPLAQFQATAFERGDMAKLVETINSSLTAGQLADNQLNEAFDVWWPQLQSLAREIKSPPVEAEVQRPERDLLEEVLETVRRLARIVESSAGPEAKYSTDEMRAVLSPTEEIVVKMVHGIEGFGKHSFEQIAPMFAVHDKALSADDVRRIYRRALKRLDSSPELLESTT